MKKIKSDGRGAGEFPELNWVELSEKLNAEGEAAGDASLAEGAEPEAGAIVSETLSQIVSEGLKVDTSDMDGVREAVESFYAYENKPVKGKKASAQQEEDEQAIRKSVDEKIIIRSEELKKKRKPANKSAGKKKTPGAATPAAAKSKSKGREVRSDASFRQAKGLEKYRKMGILPTKKDGPSDFRKKSAKWRYDDVPEAAVADGSGGAANEDTTFKDKIKNLSPVQWMSAAMAVVILITSVMTTTVYADYRGEINKESAMALLPSYVDDASQVASYDASFTTEDVEMESAAASLTDSEGKMLSLILTSVEKDLKVKLVDEDDTLVKGVQWGITVTDSKDNESSYDDEDEDGIIHLTGINAGDYSVSINDSDSLSGYVYPTVGQKVSVKAKVEYKVIANIKDEIKKESEVNAAAEDNGNKAADVEVGTAPADTVEFVESSREEDGETYEEATVDLSKTEVIATLGSRLIGALHDLAGVSRARTTGLIANIRLGAGIRMVADNDVVNDGNGSDETTPTPAPSDESGSGSEQTDDSGESDTTTTPTPESAETATPTPTPTATPTSHTHTYTKTKTKDATCTEAGVWTYTCECGDSYTESIAATGHSYAEGVCSVCGAKDPDYTADKYKSDAQLYDSAKNPLYVYDDGSYRLAKYADYKKFSTFYRKVTGYVYTGWQNIDGRTYYYTKDHEKVTGKQIIGGVEYTFNSDGSLNNGSGTLGIDVSKYQPSINWSSVKASGIDFVIIRCGYRGASTGALIEDPYFKSHIKGAKSAGLKVGVYFFSTALSEAEAVEEASMCAALCSGYGLSYPVFLDVESSSRPGYNTLSASQRTANIKAFCQTIASAGYTPGLYANKTWLTEKINTSSLSCKIWLAQYNANGPTYGGRYDIWQYTSKGSVNGISGNVDMNKSYLKY